MSVVSSIFDYFDIVCVISDFLQPHDLAVLSKTNKSLRLDLEGCDKLSRSHVIAHIHEGNADIIEWVFSTQYFKSDRRSCMLPAYAAGSGNIDSIKVLVARNYHINYYASIAAAANNHVHMLEWLHSFGATISQCVASTAAANGHIEVLEWLKDNKLDWTVHLCTSAAEHGQIHVLQWARKNNRRWSKNITEAAARGNQLDTLKWLKGNGCGLDIASILSLTSNPEIRDWILSN